MLDQLYYFLSNIYILKIESLFGDLTINLFRGGPSIMSNTTFISQLLLQCKTRFEEGFKYCISVSFKDTILNFKFNWVEMVYIST